MQRGFFLLVFMIYNFHRIFGSLMTLDQGGASNSLTNANPLQGKHLKISGLEANLDFRITRNSSGHVIQFKGVAAQMIDWLSVYRNFEYSALQVNVTPFDEIAGREGLVNFIMKGELDIAVTVSLTASRVSLVDFSYPTLYVPVSFMIPVPHLSVDFLSAIKPFQSSVWITVLAAVFAVTLSLYFFSSYSRVDGTNGNNSEDVQRENSKLLLYVLGLLLEQAVGMISNKLPVRIVFSAWFIASLIIANYYDSLLTSYMTAPNPQPLLKSIFEIRSRPEIRIVVDKNLNIDILFSSTDSGFLKEIGDRLTKFNQSSRCTPFQKCVDLVKEGDTIYVAGREAILAYGVRLDFLSTGKCNVDLSKERFMNLKLAWALKKNNPYTDIINKGIMRMREAGLLSKWYQENSPDVHQCVNDNSKKEPDPIEPLTIKHLSVAFIILLLGYAIALPFFFIELVRSGKYFIRYNMK